jgi:hypothetical protein
LSGDNFPKNSAGKSDSVPHFLIPFFPEVGHEANQEVILISAVVIAAASLRSLFINPHFIMSLPAML